MLRTSIRGLLQNIADPRMAGRLTWEMVKVPQTNLMSVRGKRNVIDGEIELLEGFEFNSASQLCTTLFSPFTGTIDRVAGTLNVNIPSLTPINMVAAPSGSTHSKVISPGAAVDFTNETFEVTTNATAIIALDNVATAVINLANPVRF